jgi:hypothetical protein
MKIISNKLRMRWLTYLLHNVFHINVPDNRKCKIYESILPTHSVSSD